MSFRLNIAYPRCSTSPPGGNQVDGLPLAPVLKVVSRIFRTFENLEKCHFLLPRSMESLEPRSSKIPPPAYYVERAVNRQPGYRSGAP